MAEELSIQKSPWIRLREYISDVRVEMRRVTWPSKQEIYGTTVMVILTTFFFGAYFALTSLYCLLAFLPYTYYSLIKSPAYSWMPWFVRHHALLFWLAGLAAATAYRRPKKRAGYFIFLGILACVGLFLRCGHFFEVWRATKPPILAAWWRGG